MPKHAIALIGPAGVGKTSVGRVLASRLNLPFYDIDCEIESAENKTITQIFSECGEEGFRASETRELKKAVKNIAVISCGGGIAVKEENRAILKENCLTVYLAASVQTLLKHVGNGEGRPMLSGDAAAKTAKLLSEREPLYSSIADIKIVTDGMSVEETADSAVKKIESIKTR